MAVTSIVYGEANADVELQFWCKGQELGRLSVSTRDDQVKTTQLLMQLPLRSRTDFEVASTRSCQRPVFVRRVIPPPD